MKTALSFDDKSVLLAGGRVLGPNENRVAIIVSAPPTNRITLSWDLNPTLDRGITLYPTNDPLILTREQIGTVIGQPLAAISAVADQTVTFHEVSIAP